MERKEANLIQTLYIERYQAFEGLLCDLMNVGGPTDKLDRELLHVKMRELRIWERGKRQSRRYPKDMKKSGKPRKLAP